MRKLASGVATYSGPDSPFNKLAGLGFGDAVDDGGLADVERAFAEPGAPVQAGSRASRTRRSARC